MGEKFEAVRSFLFENVLSIVSEHGKDVIKEEVLPMITNEIVREGGSVLLDYGANMIPGIGGAISEYRINKKIRNIETMVAILNDNNSMLQEKFEKQTTENKEILDSIFEMVIGKIENVSQKEKIKYMIDGYSEFLELSNPSFDVAYLYFDTLDKLTLLDIDVLKLSYHANYYYVLDNVDGYDGPTNYEEVLSKYDIDYSQYESIRENLVRLGLFENEYDDKVEKDFKNIEAATKELKTTVNDLYEVLNGKKKMARVKKLTSKSDVKIKAKDKIKISKFGRNFVKHFFSRRFKGNVKNYLSTLNNYLLDQSLAGLFLLEGIV